ncbi:Hypothetical protein A7982_11126 [Minicystis rosea]|nr:Hypothetical protein A7982_11126 [Minicystis rosea]
MGRPFPTFGSDALDRKCLFIGEDHADGADRLHLAWKLMWIHGLVDAIFIEYYDIGKGPVSAGAGGILSDLTEAKFVWSPTINVEVAQLKYQCDRYGIRLEGWNIPNIDNDPMKRQFKPWNQKAAAKLLQRVTELGVQRYIILGGFKHGAWFKSIKVYFKDLPCFKKSGEEFLEYDILGEFKLGVPKWI